MSEMGEDHSFPLRNKRKKPESHRSHNNSTDALPSGSDLWTDGLICAFELVRRRRRPSHSRSNSRILSRQIVGEFSKTQENGPSEGFPSRFDVGSLLEASTLSPRGSPNAPPARFDVGSLLEASTLSPKGCQNAPSDGNRDGQNQQPGSYNAGERIEDACHWVPIGWARVSELVQTMQNDADWATQQLDLMGDDSGPTVADLAAPYWERPAGPTWWCHVAAGHASVQAWLNDAKWLHPAISLALRDESRLISERMKHLLYELRCSLKVSVTYLKCSFHVTDNFLLRVQVLEKVPVRVAGGLLFELLGQSAGDPFVDEDDIPVVLRSWQAQNFLITALHIKGHMSRVNVLGITEVQELLFVGGYSAPRTVHEVIAQLASRMTRWDDRLFRKSIFGEADEIELMFMNRRNYEDMSVVGIILNQEIRRLSRQVIRVKWSLHAREEIVFELLHHLRGNAAKMLLEEIRKSTRQMIEEQEAVRGRLFTIQDVMQSTVRAWLQDRSLRVTHNLAVFGGCGLVLSIITGLFGINVDGIPGAENTPYAFGLFTAILFFIGVVLIAVGLLYLGLKKPVTEQQVEVKKLELQQLVKMFQHEAETHAQVHKNMRRNNLPPTSGDRFSDDVDYILIQ